MSAEASPDRTPRPVAGVLELQPYQQGKARLSGVSEPIKLSANESRRGPSPKAVAAYKEVADRLNLYPDGSQGALRAAIARVHGLDPQRIVCGNGSDELILLLMRAYLRAGDQVVISQYSFGMAFVHAIAQGATVVEVPEARLTPDVDALLAAVTGRTRMVVIASPNNPAGKYLNRQELSRLHGGLPADVILLIDAAYGDYVIASDYDSGSGLANRFSNVVMTRTFSKLYGLSGLRIGWACMGAELLDSIERIRTPFNTNSAALAAAEAAVLDIDYATEIRAENAKELSRLAEAFSRIGIEFIDSSANFYLLRFLGAETAAKAADYLESRGIIPRPVEAGGPERCLRITVGRPEDNDAVITALRQFMG